LHLPPLGCGTEGCTGSQGDDFFAAPNPPFGAVFTYYLAESLQSSKDARREKEKKREAKNESVEFPSWDRIISESREDEPTIVFTVRDAGGDVVRHVEAPAKAGFHRVAWDLRYPPVDAWVPEEERGDDFSPSAGVLVAPGPFAITGGFEVAGVESGDEPAPGNGLALASVKLDDAAGHLEAELDLLGGADHAGILPGAGAGAGADGDAAGRQAG